MSKKTKAVVPVKSNLPAEFADDDFFSADDNMEGVEPEFEKIKVIHKAEQFKWEDGTKTDSVTGIVIYTTPKNAYYETSYDENPDQMPVCFSNNAMVCDGENKQAKNCSQCDHNKFGTSVNKDGSFGRGKACNNNRQFFIILPDKLFPIQLQLSSSALKPWGKFVTKLSEKRRKYNTYVIKISLVPEKNKGGIEYSAPVFEVESDIATTDYAKLKTMYQQFQAKFVAAKIERDESTYKPEEDPNFDKNAQDVF